MEQIRNDTEPAVKVHEMSRLKFLKNAKSYIKKFGLKIEKDYSV